MKGSRFSFGKSKSQSAPLPVSPRARLNSGKLTLEDVLADPVLLAFFSDYLLASLCEENLACFRAIATFKLSGHFPGLMIWLARHLYETYLSSTATAPVNVEASIRVALCEAYLAAPNDVTADFFDPAAGALQKLLVQDCLTRFFTSREYEAHKTLATSLGKIFANPPLARELRLHVDQSYTGKYTPLPAMMEDLTLVEGKGGVRGTLACSGSVARCLKMLTEGEKYAEWIPDVESSTLVSAHGSYVSVYRIALESGPILSLGVVKLEAGVCRGCVAWESALGAKEATSEVSGGFTLSLCQTASGDWNACRINLMLKCKGKAKAAKLVENVLLGLRMAIGSSVEARVADLGDDLQFLKRL
jgi:hypothetical protein